MHTGTSSLTDGASSSTGSASNSRRLLGPLLHHLGGVTAAASLAKTVVHEADQDPLTKGTPLEGGVQSLLTPSLPVKAQLLVPQQLATLAPGLLGSLPKGGDIRLSDFAFPGAARITDPLLALSEPLGMAQQMGSFGMQMGALVPGLAALSSAPASVPEQVSQVPKASLQSAPSCRLVC